MNTPKPSHSRAERPSKDKSFEEIKKRLMNPPNLPSAIRQIVGTENARKLSEVICSEPIAEVDAFVAAGEMTSHQAMQYMRLLPDYDEAKLKIRTIIPNMVATFKPMIKGMVSATKRGDRRNGIYKAFELLHNFGGLLGAMGAGFRNLLVNDFVVTALASYTDALDSECGTSDKPTVDAIIQELNQTWAKTYGGNSFPGYQFFNEKRSYKEDLKYTSRRNALEKVASASPMDENEKIEIELELASKLQEIQELRQYRRVYFTPHGFEGTKVGILGDDLLDKESSHPGICHFQIALVPSQDLALPKLAKMAGFRAVDYGLREGVFNLYCEVDGELGFNTNSAARISELIGEPQYLRLKLRLYDLLLDYLRGKEPDIEDLFLDKKHEVKVQKIETREQVKNVFKPEVEPEISPVSPGVQEETPDFEELPTPQPESVPDFETRKEKQLYLLNRIRGIKGKRVKSALQRIMGPPERIRGSHQFFRSPYNNALFPIPIHASHTVKFPLLRACLEEWDISLEEFCESV